MKRSPAIWILFLIMAASDPETLSGARSIQADTSGSMENPSTTISPFTFSGQIRLRYESYNGYTLKGYAPDNHDDILLERLRLELRARIWNDARFFLQLQDAHAMLTRFRDDDFPQSSPIENTLDIRQLYFEWLHIGGSPFGLRVGRQQISHGDQRVFGPGSWGNTGRFAWDAAMLKVDARPFWMDMWVGKFLEYKSSTWPDKAVSDFMAFVAYTGIEYADRHLDGFYAYKNDTRLLIAGETSSGFSTTHTFGLQGEIQWGATMDAGATVVGQFGRHGGDVVRASAMNAKLGFSPDWRMNPRIGVQLTRGSGDSDPTDGVHGTFDGVFGGRDIQFYGYLSLFFWANLRDHELSLRFEPHSTMTVYLHVHHFTLDSRRDAWYTTGMKAYRRDLAGQSGRTLGNEVDVRIVWKPATRIELLAACGRFFAGSFVSHTGPSSPANWYTVQSSYTW